MNLPLIVSVIAGLLLVISLIQPLAERMRLSSSVLLAVVGIVIGLGSATLLFTDATDALNEIAGTIVYLPIDSEVFLYVFLPLLIFQTSLTLDVRRMAEDYAAILLLAVVAVLVATVVIGLALEPASGLPLVACLLLGAIVATTDPVAVVAIFRDIGAPARLGRLVEGESLLNDAAAITLYVVLLEMLVAADREISFGQATIDFVRTFMGGLVAGYVVARAVVALLTVVRGMRLAQVTLSVALPYLVFVVNEQLLGVSGVVGVVTAGIVFNLGGPMRVSPDSWKYLQEVWEQIAFWASSLIFVLASILIPKLLVNVGIWDLVLLGILVVAALVARALVLFGLLPVLSKLRLGQAVSNPFKTVILWGGLRGAVTLALALAVTENYRVPPEVQRFVAVLATGFVLFTLLVNGTTLRPLIKLLKLDRLSPVDLALRTQVLALALTSVRDTVKEVALEYRIGTKPTQDVVRFYEERAMDAAAQTEQAPDIADRDRITLGLVALANQERELILQQFRERTVSISLIETLLVHVDGLLDRARQGGRLEYMRAARRALRFTPQFRLAQLVQRRLGIERWLADQLIDRFELLLVIRIVLDDLAGFVRTRITPILGARVAEILQDILDQRHEAVDKALHALRLQYPDYADMLERRFLRKVGLRREEQEFRVLFDEGLIGSELYEDLRRDIAAARQRADQRPKLDLGLQTRDLIAQCPMFDDLTPEQVDTLTQMLRPRFAVPGERLIRQGDRGDAVYFITSGAVEVRVADRTVQLGRGDFFGELALLTGRRRQSDVVALGYCQLLLLYEADFRTLLTRNPGMRARVDRIANARMQMNENGGEAAAAPAGQASDSKSEP